MLTITTTQGHVEVVRYENQFLVTYSLSNAWAPSRSVLIATVTGDDIHGSAAQAIAGKFGDLLGELDQYAAKIVAESEGETP